MKKTLSLLILLITALSGFGQSVTGPQRLLYATKSEVRTYGVNLARAYQIYNFSTRQDEFFVYDSSDTTSPESDSVVVSGAARFKRMTRIPGGSGGSLAWNDITGKPSTFTPSSHNQAISTITGLQDSLNTRQKAITAGTISQYWRGDKTWQTLNGAAVGFSFVKNVDQTIANNLTSGTIPSGRYGSATIPISAINATGTAGSGNYLRGDGTWSTPSGGGGAPSVAARSLFGNDSTGAKTGVSLSVLQVKALLNIPVTPKDFGAIGNGTTNDSTAFAQWAAAAASVPGRYVIGAGTYKINGTVTFAFNGTAAFQTVIEASGAKIITDNATTKPVIRINNTKRMTLHGLTVVGTVDTDGMWQSTLLDNEFDIVRIGVSNLDTFDEGYYNNWTGGEINELHIYTGTTGGDLTEFNSNVFNSVKFQGGSYAFKIYGTGLAQGVVFNHCDISYQSTSILYVDASTAGDVSLFFNFCYLDSENGFPYELKGVKVIPNGCIVPNSANVGTFFTDAHSQTPSSSFSGVRQGSSSASGVANLISNGDFRDGVSGFSTTWTASMVAGAGQYGQYLHATASGTQKEIIFTSLPAPYTGYYSLSMIARNVANTVVVSSSFLNGIDSLYSPVNLVASTTKFAQGQTKIYLTQGTVYTFKIYSQASVSNEIDIAYVALTYGSVAPEMAITHPAARTTPTAKNNTNYFQGGDGASVGTSISASTAGLSAVADTTNDKTGEGYVLRYNPSTSDDYPVITFTLPNAYLRKAKDEGMVTLTMWAKVTSGYGDFSTNLGFASTYVSPGVTTGGGWNKWTVRAAVTAGATRVQFKITMAAAATAKDIRFDAIQMNIGNESVPWGPSPLDAGSGGGTAVTGLATISNVAALRTRSCLVNGEMVRTLGYYTNNDTNGAFYICNTSSTAADDGGAYIQSNSQATGRWELVYGSTVRAGWWGVIGNNTTDCTNSLIASTAFVITRALKMELPTGIVKITNPWTIGTASPLSLPGGEQATIVGGGPSFNWLASDPIFTTGTLIRLVGTGKSSIVNIQAGAGRYLHLADFTVSCDTEGGATNGIYWSQTGHSEHILDRVYSYRANRAFAISRGGFANGEFITLNKCTGKGVTHFWWMDTDTGQSFNHLLNHCHGSVNDGGTLFEFGGSNLGFGFTAIEFNSSNAINFSTSTGVTFIKNNGISGIVNFIGGRIEGVSTMLWNVMGSQNQRGKINITGMHSDGMGSNATRLFMKSTSSNSRQQITFDKCIFTPIDPAMQINIQLGSTDNSEYTFKKCEFQTIKTYAVLLSETVDGKVIFDDCQRDNASTSGIVRFSKTYAFNTSAPLPSVSKPQNLLLQSGFGTPSGATVTATSPWVHSGTSSTFYALYNYSNHLGGYTTSDANFRQAVFSTTSNAYQNITAAPFNTGANLYYYKAMVSYHAATGMSLRITLLNSSTGTVYDQVTIKGSSAAGSILPIELTANDGNVGGVLQLKFENLDAGNPFYLNVYYQHVTTNPAASYAPTTTTTVDLPWVVTSTGGGSSGTVTTASVVSANGFAGSVANATTTPAITLSTSITGLLKGNGTAMSAAGASDLPSAIDVTKLADGSVTSTELQYINSLSSNAQTQIDAKADKLITTNRQTASYTLVLGDAGKLVEQNVASANNLTVPLNSSVAFPTGTQILIAQYGAGQVTIVATGGVTIRSSGAKLKLTGQYSGATLVKIATDEWYLFGDITN